MKEKLINILIAAASFPYGMDSRSEIELLADYLIKKGVIVLPCKVGDTVYTNCAMTGWYFRKKDKPYSAKVVFIGLNDSEKMGGGLINVVYGKHDFMMQFSFSDIGEKLWGGIAGQICETMIEGRDYERHIKKGEANG